MNGPFKWACSHYQKRLKFFSSWTFTGKFEISYLGHQFKKKTPIRNEQKPFDRIKTIRQDIKKMLSSPRVKEFNV